MNISDTFSDGDLVAPHWSTNGEGISDHYAQISDETPEPTGNWGNLAAAVILMLITLWAALFLKP